MISEGIIFQTSKVHGTSFSQHSVSFFFECPTNLTDTKMHIFSHCGICSQDTVSTEHLFQTGVEVDTVSGSATTPNEKYGKRFCDYPE